MSYNSGKITAPVSIYDVQQCLGNSSVDLKTLCTAPNINPWSKRKPVEPSESRYIYVPLVMPNQGKTDEYTFLTLNKDWGIRVWNTVRNTALASFISMDETGEGGSDPWLVLKAVGEKFLWQHRPPTTVGRLTDFNGYDHKAVPPFYTNYQSDVIDVYTQSDTYRFVVYFFITHNSSSVTLSDLTQYQIGGVKLTDTYVVGASSAGDTEAKFSYATLGNTYGDAEIAFNLEAGDRDNGQVHNLYFALANQKEWKGAMFWPMPVGNNLFNHLTVRVHMVDIFAEMTLKRIGSVRGIGEQALNTFDFRSQSDSKWVTRLADASRFDYYGASNPATLYTDSNGNGVVLELSCTVGERNVTGLSRSQVAMALNTGTNVLAAVQIVGGNINDSYPSTDVTSLVLQAYTTYTFYVVARGRVADNENEVQLSMNFASHVQEGLAAATPWMMVYTS